MSRIKIPTKPLGYDCFANRSRLCLLHPGSSDTYVPGESHAPSRLIPTYSRVALGPRELPGENGAIRKRVARYRRRIDRIFSRIEARTCRRVDRCLVFISCRNSRFPARKRGLSCTRGASNTMECRVHGESAHRLRELPKGSGAWVAPIYDDMRGSWKRIDGKRGGTCTR